MGERLAIVIPVPAADLLVGPLRDRLDPAAGWGVGAHVTLLAPIPSEVGLDPERRERLREVVGRTLFFELELRRTGWFGEDVLWLDPEPLTSVLDLIAVVGAVFPDVPPYEGRFPDPRPHLTVGQRPPASATDLRAAEGAVQEMLPIRASVTAVDVLRGVDEPGGWRTVERIDLA